MVTLFFPEFTLQQNSFLASTQVCVFTGGEGEVGGAPTVHGDDGGPHYEVCACAVWYALLGAA